ncbi:hypothetical protein G9A89_018128 [Geosiphon pyriformis]|nr:hypothetical protein G9A89_018128 [Geosiphon pyriformis]
MRAFIVSITKGLISILLIVKFCKVRNLVYPTLEKLIKMPNNKQELITATTEKVKGRKSREIHFYHFLVIKRKVGLIDLFEETVIQEGSTSDFKSISDIPKELKNTIRENSAAVEGAAAIAFESATPGKRRSSSPIRDEGVKNPPEKKQKARKEKEKKTKTTGRNKGPIDLDKQCGVIPPNSTTPCTRSLTCKSHSMALKRGVLGRSQPYDILLQQYQKKGIGRPQNNNQAGAKNDPNKKDGGKGDGGEKVEEEEIDSDIEVTLVLEGIRRSNPQPLATRRISYHSMPRTNYFDYQDMLSESFKTK